MKDGGHLARRGAVRPPPRLEQTGAEEPRAGCINEQAVLKGTGSCNADEWSLQSRDERREQKGRRREGRGGGGKCSEVGTEGAVMRKGFNLHLGFL